MGRNSFPGLRPYDLRPGKEVKVQLSVGRSTCSEIVEKTAVVAPHNAKGWGSLLVVAVAVKALF